MLRIEAYCTARPYRTKQWSPDLLKWVSVKKLRQCPHERKGEQKVPEMAVLGVCLGREEHKLPCGWIVGIKDGRGMAVEGLWDSPTVCQASLHTLSHSFLKQPYKVGIIITILLMSTLSTERWGNLLRTTWVSVQSLGHLSPVLNSSHYTKEVKATHAGSRMPGNYHF